MANMAIMCRCVEISLLGCVEQNVVQNVPSLTRFLPTCNPPFLGDVGIKKWSLLLDSGAQSTIFGAPEYGHFRPKSSHLRLHVIH